MSKKEVELSKEEVSESFTEALEKGEVTDLMGNKMNPDDFVMYDVEPKKELSYEEIMNVIKRLQGKVLTIVDATYDDKERGKYVKDLIRGSFSDQADWIFELIKPEQTK